MKLAQLRQVLELADADRDESGYYLIDGDIRILLGCDTDDVEVVIPEHTCLYLNYRRHSLPTILAWYLPAIRLSPDLDK